ncbi:hypothetical protein B4Q13_22345 [Lacticaseibacillus rhamnosus]
MSDADMLEIARYASTQPWPKVEPVSTDAALLKKGAYATALVDCAEILGKADASVAWDVMTNFLPIAPMHCCHASYANVWMNN